MCDRVSLTFAEAINEGLDLCMQDDPDVMVMGQLVDMPAGIFGTTTGLFDKYPGRVFDFPVAEGLMHAAGIGLTLTGKRPVICHQRIDFMAPGLDPIINWLGLWRFKTGGQNIPLTIRAVVGKGWGQAPQHSKNLAGLLATIPGIRIYCPTNPHDAKGMMIDAIYSEAPCILIEHRSLFNVQQEVPTGMYVTRHTPRHLKQGHHATVVVVGDLVPLTYSVVDNLGYTERVDLWDLRMIRPLGGYGFQAIRESVRDTGNLLVIDSGWTDFGISAEIIAQVMDGEDSYIRVKRLGYPDGYTPMSKANEAMFYPDADRIKREIDLILA